MAEYKAIPQGYMTVGEVAKKIGLTVRALQYYDRKGFFCPSCVSEGGRRLYSNEDVVRLHRILALRSLGMSFDEINSKFLSIDTPDKAIEELTEQANAIQSQIKLLSKSLQEIDALKSEIKQMKSVDFDKYASIIVNLQMGNRNYGMIKHFDRDLLEHCYNKFDKESGQEFIKAFDAIIDKAQMYLEDGIAPDSEQGLSLAREFWQIVTDFIDGDLSLLPKLLNAKNAQGEECKNIKLEKAINSFIAPALERYFIAAGIDPLGGQNG